MLARAAQGSPRVQSAKLRDLGGLEVPAGRQSRRRRGQKQHQHEPGLIPKHEGDIKLSKSHHGLLPGGTLAVVEPCAIALQTGLNLHRRDG